MHACNMAANGLKSSVHQLIDCGLLAFKKAKAEEEAVGRSPCSAHIMIISMAEQPDGTVLCCCRQPPQKYKRQSTMRQWETMWIDFDM
eukprot:scaffold83787_cov19-Tisochrysis_lutea.AAC.1